jgi:hypothetical protein
MQRVQLSNSLHQYATELGGSPEEDRSDEENGFLELRGMIDKGQFGDGEVKIELCSAASVEDGRFLVKQMRERRWSKEDCWVLLADKCAQGQQGDNWVPDNWDLWMLCARELVKVHWNSQFLNKRMQLKLVLGAGWLLSVVDTPFGDTVYKEGKLESVGDSTDEDVDIVPSLLRPLAGPDARHKPIMVAPLRGAICACMEMRLVDDDDLLYMPCMKIGRHG